MGIHRLNCKYIYIYITVILIDLLYYWASSRQGGGVSFYQKGSSLSYRPRKVLRLNFEMSFFHLNVHQSLNKFEFKLNFTPKDFLDSAFCIDFHSFNVTGIT